MIMDIRQRTASPTAKDQGNVGIQGRIVPKTIKLALFTENRNAVWAGRQILRKASYPFAMITFPANRKTFLFEVGECFKFSYASWGVTDMICRVMAKEEESVESEAMKVYAMEDIFSVALAVDEYSEDDDFAQEPVDYSVFPFLEQTAIEAPFALLETIEVIPMACRQSTVDLGFLLYMSIDGGASYSLLKTMGNIQPFGTLGVAYSADTYPIDDYSGGFLIDFTDNGDVDRIETVTWPEVLAATKNNAMLGNELITFQTITPVSGNQYRIENIIRGRWDTVRETHSIGEHFWFIGPTSDIDSAADSQISAGVTRQFKLVPYNVRMAGNISVATAVPLSITGRARTPYTPGNLAANGSSSAARYNDDVILTWSPRNRGAGAGIGIPGEVLADTRREGLFSVEVWVGGIIQRATSFIDADTWTYTAAMNHADNGALAHEILFKVSNYAAPEDGSIYESVKAEVTCRRNPGLAS